MSYITSEVGHMERQTPNTDLLRRPRLYAIRLKVLLGDAQIYWTFIVPTWLP